jgi:phosphonate transport system substrate-binding protein
LKKVLIERIFSGGIAACRRLSITILLAILTSMMLTGCDQQEQTSQGPVYHETMDNRKPVYRLAIHPLHNPRKLTEAYQPLLDYLNRKMPDVHIELEASRDYQAYEAKFRERGPDLLLPNPWQTLEAIKVGYRVLAMAGDAEDFKGIFIVRKDSGIKSPQDLRGKVVSYPSHTALAACIMPQRYLFDNGLNITTEINNRYVGSQESSIMNVFLGESAAGATWPPPWRLFQRDRPEEASKLMVIWETPPLLNNSVMARLDVPFAVTQKLTGLLVNLNQSEEGLKILKGMETARFHEADNTTYDTVRQFVAEFEKDVRPVEQP